MYQLMQRICRNMQKHVWKKTLQQEAKMFWILVHTNVTSSPQWFVQCLQCSTDAFLYFPPSWLGFELLDTKTLYSLIAVGTCLDAEAKSEDVLYCCFNSPQRGWKVFSTIEFSPHHPVCWCLQARQQFVNCAYFLHL